MPLRIGETFAGYRVLQLLGSGGMGDVYRVQHPRLARQDALKVLRPDISADASFRDRFIREADLAAGLWHPHIVGVHDRGECDGQLWITMDFVDGQDAAQVVERRYPAGMPADEVASIVTAIASALDYAHNRGLIHRDVKPANIMLAQPDNDQRRILLADFGIARPLDDPAGLTTTNMTVGTVAYAAPEQLMGDDIDGRADQYALAATTYYLLTGKVPFPHSNPAVVISKHLSATPPMLSESNPELRALDPVLATGMAKRRDDRFFRTSDFAASLNEHVAVHSSAAPLAPTAPAPIPQRRLVSETSAAEPSTLVPPTINRRRRTVVVGVVGGIVVASLVAAFLVLKPEPELQSYPKGSTSVVSPTLPAPLVPLPPPIFPAAAIDTLILNVGEVNSTLGTSTLEIKDSSFGTSDNTADVTPAACVGVVHGAEQLVYKSTGFLEMRNQNLYPRPYTESQATESGRPWMGQQIVAIFPTEKQARTLLASSEARWRSCASESVMESGYEFTVAWDLRNIQLRGDVLTVSLVDPSPVPGPNAGACQHAMGLRLNVIAEAVTCTASTSVAGNGAERMVFAILDKVHA